MNPSQPRLPGQDGEPRAPSTRRVGKVSEFLGGRLLMIWVMTGVAGLALLTFAGIRLWLVVTRGSLGRDVVPLVIAGSLALALLSISGSARRNGLKYLRGERAVSSDLARFLARRIERRRQARGR
jgi:hypothetical protein